MNQEQREARMLDKGVERFRVAWANARARGDTGDQPAVKDLVTSQIANTSAAIQEWLEKSRSGSPGRNAAHVKYVPHLEPDILAFLTARFVLNGIITGNSYMTIQRELGAAVEDEWMCKALDAHDPTAMKWVEKQSKERNLPVHMKRAYVRRMGELRGAKHHPWPSAVRIKVGAILIELFARATRLIKIETTREGKKTKCQITATPQILSWVTNRNDTLGLLAPMFEPMVEKPRRWTENEFGGYLTLDLPPVKNRAQGIPNDVREALDHMNGTAYRINGVVLDVLTWCHEQGHSILKTERAELPEMPITDDPQIRRDYRKRTRMAHDQNRAAGSIALTISRVCEVANRFRTQPELYFPSQLDFRGRVYPLPADLNPQGPDFVRGLLEFSEAKKCDHMGMFWLRVHGANMWGNDKMSLQERAQWAIENHDYIWDAAEAPIESRSWWMSAEKPFQFLQWCLDYTEAMNYGYSRCRVSLDGSCNGIQHFAAMLRDPVAARAVNLTESSLPRDIYQDVADVVIQRLKDETSMPERLWADQLLAEEKVNRKLTKRSVMVMPYGGTFSSTMTYVGAELRAEHNFGDDIDKVVVYLAKHVHEATREVVKGGARVMAWLQGVAKEANKTGDHLRWTVPTGFEVTQCYTKTQVKVVQTWLYGKALVDTFDYIPTDKIDGPASRNGVSPNFVHSLDAAAMMLTINAAAKEGMTHFHCIHDDFGVHAQDTEAFGVILRDQFVRMYEENDVLLDFWKSQKTFSPEPPAKLGFDLGEVRKSLYFFS